MSLPSVGSSSGAAGLLLRSGADIDRQLLLPRYVRTAQILVRLQGGPVYMFKKGKVFPYSLPSVGPGADPGVQAVSPQVT